MVIAVTTSVSVAVASVGPRVIYGTDNRKDLYEVQDQRILELSQATVALIPKGNLQLQSSGLFELQSQSLGELMNLCPDEPFRDQPNAANCSGALVGEDLVATAGHCITDETCSMYYLVFNYNVNSALALPQYFSSRDVYMCDSVVARERTLFQDWALVRLDRAPRHLAPIKMSSQKAEVGDDVFVIGHPSGLPTKFADGARVRSEGNGFFVANLDTYAGNSGSPVFSTQSLEIVGLLVRGATDYRYDTQKQCVSSNFCDDSSCRGEDVTHISFVSDALTTVYPH